MKTTPIQYNNKISYELIAGYPQEQQWYPSAEPETKQWIDKNVKPDWTVLDIGAHIGIFTMFLSYKANKGLVFAFEPCAASRQMLALNLTHNSGKWGHKFTNVIVSPQAVGDKSGVDVEETLWLTDGSENYGKTTSKFLMTTLDNYCLKHPHIKRLDFIKCDIDGWDYDGLIGGKETIKKFQPIIIVECNYALSWRGHNQDDVDRFLKEVGYQHKVIDPTPGNWLCWPEGKLGG